MLKFLNNRKILSIGGFFLVVGLSLYVYLNSFNPSFRFRTMQDDITLADKVDLKGLREINASGGSALNIGVLKTKLDHINLPKLVVDAKNEAPGYIDGHPISFYRYGQSGPRLKHVVRRIVHTGTVFEKPELIVSGEEEAKKNGFSYKPIIICSRFTTPPEQVDKAVALLESIPQDTWVHFHCKHGHGRTTMLLVMLDMIRNAPAVSLENIITRQHRLGGVNLLDTVVWPGKGTYTQKQLDDRKEFIENFYKFICQRKEGGIQLWSDWIRPHQGV